METNIKFRAFEIEDAPFINNLRSNENFENMIGGNKKFVSSKRDLKWVEDIIFKDFQDKVYVAIYLKDDLERKIIGYASIVNIDHYNKNCEWGGIKIEEKFNGKGFGSEAARWLIKYVFEELNMERFYARCLENHLVSFKMMKKVGFITEGVIRNSVFKSGNYQNEYLMSVLKSDYQKIKECAIF